MVKNASIHRDLWWFLVCRGACAEASPPTVQAEAHATWGVGDMIKVEFKHRRCNTAALLDDRITKFPLVAARYKTWQGELVVDEASMVPLMLGRSSFTQACFGLAAIRKPSKWLCFN